MREQNLPIGYFYYLRWEILRVLSGSGYWGFYGDGGVASGAWLDNPTGVSVDNAGNLYIADKGNNRIRKTRFENAVWEPVKPSFELRLYPNPTDGVLFISSAYRCSGNVGRASILFFAS